MFIISLAIFTFILTVFENIFLALLSLVLILLWSLISEKFKKISRGFFFIILAFLISTISVFFKNYKYDQKIKPLLNTTWTIAKNMDGPVWKYFVGTGIISDIYSYQKYVFQDNFGREYFLISSKTFEIWDIVWLNGNVSLAYTGAGNIFDFQKQWKDFSSKPELSWLFNYEFNYSKWLMMKDFYGTIYGQSYIVFKDNCEYNRFADEEKLAISDSDKSNSAELDKNISNLSAEFQKWNSQTSKNSQSFLWSGDFFDENQSSKELCKSQISFIQKIRKALQRAVISAYGENKQAGLILWMLVWDRSQIPPDEYQWFINSGLVHIIAVSWWNIIMIVVFLGAVLFFLPFYARNAVSLLTIVLYSMVCGLDSSVFRATVMWWLGMLALFWWKEINIWRAMSVAFIIMLIINPYFLTYDVGFLLSFSAIIGIIYFWKLIAVLQKALEKKEKSEPFFDKKEKKRSFSLTSIKKAIQKFLKEFVTPTVGATIGVLPVMLFFMGTTNLTWIIANFLVVPIVAVVMIYWFISTVLFQIIPRNIRLLPEKWLLNYVYLMSDLAQEFWIYLHAEGTWIKYFLLALFIVWLLMVRHRSS